MSKKHTQQEICGGIVILKCRNELIMSLHSHMPFPSTWNWNYFYLLLLNTALSFHNHYDLCSKRLHLWMCFVCLVIPVQFSHSVVTDSLRPHEPQNARPPCPSLTPRVYPNLRTSSRWCHPAISSSVILCSSCPQSFPASGSFPMSQLFTWGGQSTGVSASTSVLPMNTQDWSL